uniref:Xpo1 domain-containing protein n=1 Tax=Onchocerca volvulus TaxID=6282 RepID=A0A8R1TRJ5_ONCVO
MEEKLNVIGDALEAIYNTTISNERRAAASQVIESVKELSPIDVEQIAYALISKRDLILARTGWNFLEHIIKFKWLEIDGQSRLAIRYTCFAAMKSESMLRNELRCAAARCVVLMIEHEWPQNWPELFDELEDIASVSAIHAQIPFITLQLLIENVITLVTVENISRRKDLNNAIASNVPRILHIIHFALRECSIESTDESYSLIRSALNLFGELVEWPPANVLEPYINDFLYTICSFLETPQHCIYELAAKCLWRIASRKQAKNEENLVLALFGDVPMRSILKAANQAASVGAENVEHYRFLKTLCNVLSSLGIHLADVWTQRPPNFGMYLAAIEAFFLHSSVYLRNEAVAVFASLINHEKIGDDEIFNECICRVIISTPSLLEKVGYPTQNDHETCRFSQHDYDDDNDFSHDFTRAIQFDYNYAIKFRDRCLKVIRSCCTEKYSHLLISIVEKWFISRCLDHTDLVRQTEWNAMQRFSKLVLWECHSRKLLKPDDYKRLSSLFNGMLILLANCTSPLLMNNLLSMISTLLITIGSYPQLLISLLTQLRRPLSDKVDDDIDEKSVKRHCLALLLRVVTIFADDIKEQAGTILEFCLSMRPSLTLMQLASCMQVVAALSNLCVDFVTQNNFLCSALSDSVSYFLQAEIQDIFRSDMAFLTYFGFTSPAAANIMEATKSSFMLSRRRFRAHLSTLEGIMAQTQSIAPPFHPAYSAFRPILPAIFLLAKRLNSLYDPKNASIIHISYGPLSIFEITTSERQQLLRPIDLYSSSTARNLSDDPGTHARAFLCDVTEKVQVFTFILFLEIGSWVLFLSCHLTFVPDFRLRFWLRRTWKPFLCACPEIAYHNVRPLLLIVVEELSKRLQSKWEQLAVSECLEDDEFCQEQLLNEHMACILTRECVVLLRDLFGISDASDKIEETSFIKNCFLKDEEVIGKIVECIFFCLTYRDSTSVARIIPVCKNVIENLNERCTEEIAVFMLVQSIQSLQIHGSDESTVTHLLSLVFFIYSFLKDRFSSLSQVLQQVPGCSVEDVQRLDQRIASMKCSKDFANEKMKREVMKKLLRTVIAASFLSVLRDGSSAQLLIGEQHRRPIHLRPLPPIPKNKEHSKEGFIDFGFLFGDI